jgi:hypothetical protein
MEDGEQIDIPVAVPIVLAEIDERVGGVEELFYEVTRAGRVRAGEEAFTMSPPTVRSPFDNSS